MLHSRVFPSTSERAHQWVEAPRVQPQASHNDAGKSDHREVFAEPGAIKLKRSQDWGDIKLCFSAPSKLGHYCMTYPNLGP